jgi:ABC-type branched-subunit amino acid transport system substrate-binding protein
VEGPVLRADNKADGKVSKLVAAATAVTLALTLAACGSNLDPEDVQGLGGANGTAQGGVVDPDGTVAGGDTGGTTTGGDPTGTTTGGTTGTTTGGTSGGTSGGSNGGTNGGDGGTQGDGDNSATGGDGGASCEGFKNGPGITDTEIVIGNASDISGPVPGLFEASQDATKAYVAYFNSTSDICGRKLKLVTYDSRTDASADQQAYTKACDEVFAMVGSMSAFDSGGANTAQACGLPDIRSAAVTNERNACATCFGAQSTNTGQHQNIVADYILKNYGSAGQHAAFFYINAGAAAQNAPVQASAMTKRGMHFDIVQGIDIAEFNYAPYVQQLKDENIEVVFWTGAYQQSVRLRQAMQQQGYTPKLYMRDPTDYNPDFVESGGSAVDGTVVFTNFTPFEEASRNKETALYMSWLQQVRPGADPTFFGVFSWSAARLFVEKAIALGGGLDRAALVNAVKSTAKWTANDLHSPQNVGTKQTGDCWRFIQLNDGTWGPVGGTKYQCAGVTAG